MVGSDEDEEIGRKERICRWSGLMRLSMPFEHETDKPRQDERRRREAKGKEAKSRLGRAPLPTTAAAAKSRQRRRGRWSAHDTV